MSDAERAARAEVLQRLRDYEMENIHQLKARLVERWKEAHPEAAREASAAFKPLMLHPEHVKATPHDPDECWFNDVYYVTVRRNVIDRVFGTGKSMIQLGIASHDGTARHDWRDFQAIKNQLAGEDCEAFELYPSEGRLLDPSNYYSIWCFPFLRKLRLGQDFRRVLDADKAWAPQRAFARDASA